MGIDISKLIAEPHLDSRLEQAIEKARHFVHDSPETDEDMEMQLRIILSEHYGMPIFDDYFDRPIDHLAMEVAIIAERKKKSETTAGQSVLQNLDEASAYAAEGWEDEPPPLSDEEKAKYTKFMQSSDFIKE